MVTGGASGIGRALCERLAAGGTRVAVVDRDTAAAGRVAGALASAGAAAFTADVTVEPDVVDLVERVEAVLGPIGLYCSNAGVGGAAGLGSDEDWERHWSVHVLAHVYAARAVLPKMAGRGGGRMVLTASAAGLLSMTQSAPYTVTKHATVALAEWLAINWADRGIQMGCLCPQGVRTPMLNDEAAVAEVGASGAILEPSEVAERVIEALEDGRFLILPHPEVHGYEIARVADRDRWLEGMKRLAGRLAGGHEPGPAGT